MNDEDLARAIRLALIGAKCQHEIGIQQGSAGSHQDDGSLQLGAAICRHPDCVWARTATPPRKGAA